MQTVARSNHRRYASIYPFTLMLTTRDYGTRWKAHFGRWNRVRTVSSWDYFVPFGLQQIASRAVAVMKARRMTGYWRELNRVALWPPVERLFQLLLTRLGRCVVCLSTILRGLLLTRTAVYRRRYTDNRVQAHYVLQNLGEQSWTWSQPILRMRSANVSQVRHSTLRPPIFNSQSIGVFKL